MQCASCHFQNLPGTELCGRCGARLQPAATAVGVHPPRAGKWEKWRGRWFPTYALLAWLRELPRRRVFGYDEDPPPGALPRTILPGWAQFYMGHPIRGGLFSVTYVVCLFTGLLFIGTQRGSVFLGLALAAHFGSVWDIASAGLHSFQERIYFHVKLCVGLAILVYLPAGWLLTRFATPQRIMMNAPPFAPGDVVLCNRWACFWASPDPGDVVLYQIPSVRITLRNRAGANTIYQAVGQRIDRIVATGGQKVEWQGGSVRVDGRPSPWLPLNPQRLPERLNVTVPEGHYLILPSSEPYDLWGAFGADWQQLSLVPAENVTATVYLRLQPLSRLSWIH